jgi:hypothetical protein
MEHVVIPRGEIVFRSKRMRVLLALLASALLAGCTSTVFSSGSLTKPRDHNGDAVGISYSLPRANIGMRVLAVAPNAQIMVCVRDAIAVSDPGQQYFMQFQNNPFSADKFTVKRNELLGTLEEIDIKAQDQFDQFVINLGKSAGALSAPRFQSSLTDACSSPPANTYELGDIEFDPVDHEAVRRSRDLVNSVVMTFIEERVRDCGRRGKDAPAFLPHACREYQRMHKQFERTRDPILMKWDLPKIPRNVATPRCEQGFCYRHTLPHTLHLSIGNSSVYSHTFQIPNSSPIVSLDLTRAIAVTKTTKITFGRMGEIKQIDVQKGRGDPTTGAVTDGAEAVELALLPQAVINAYFQQGEGHDGHHCKHVHESEDGNRQSQGSG